MYNILPRWPFFVRSYFREIAMEKATSDRNVANRNIATGKKHLTFVLGLLLLKPGSQYDAGASVVSVASVIL